MGLWPITRSRLEKERSNWSTALVNKEVMAADKTENSIKERFNHTMFNEAEIIVGCFSQVQKSELSVYGKLSSKLQFGAMYYANDTLVWFYF